jgi:hypothetical protein
MNTRDTGASTLAMLYEQYSEICPFRTERYRERARREHPRFSEIGIKRVVLERFERDNPSFFAEMRKQMFVPKPEPRNSSPTEQIKARTSMLNPAGELTGGNYGARF